jgi:glycosyltransferase involved in cell wall biosynthesis
VSSSSVNVCIPTHNDEKTIATTLRSVISQTYPNISITVVDNCSTDGTRDAAESVFDSRCTFLGSDRNIGAEGNFTRCIQLAKGDYTAIYHADDIYDPIMISEQVALLDEHPDIAAVFAGANLIDENGHKIGEHYGLNLFPTAISIFDFITLFRHILQHHNFLMCPSAMVRTSIYRDEIKEWRGALFGSSADLDVWLRIAQTHKIAVINKPLLQYRLSKSQGSYVSDRIRTTRAAFFSVTDYYSNQKTIASQLTNEDRYHLQALELIDLVKRVLNLMKFKKYSEAKQQTNLFWKLISFKMILANKKMLKFILVMLFLTSANNIFLRKFFMPIIIKCRSE